MGLRKSFLIEVSVGVVNLTVVGADVVEMVVSLTVVVSGVVVVIVVVVVTVVVVAASVVVAVVVVVDVVVGVVFNLSGNFRVTGFSDPPSPAARGLQQMLFCRPLSSQLTNLQNLGSPSLSLPSPTAAVVAVVGVTPAVLISLACSVSWFSSTSFFLSSSSSFLLSSSPSFSLLSSSSSFSLLSSSWSLFLLASCRMAETPRPSLSLPGCTGLLLLLLSKLRSLPRSEPRIAIAITVYKKHSLTSK